MLWKKLVLVLFVLFSCIACRSANEGKTVTPPSDPNHPATIELDVYSGRPNPNWIPTAPERTEIGQHFQNLTALPTLPAVPDNLGYRGFLIHYPDGTIEVRVYHGTIFITRAGHTDAYQDSHALENWLKEQARVHGEGDILKATGQ
ncbi:MAG TPA: hypothetical protein VFN35_24855 [Ktedonobacteraceae bacterium]|nr:hypothetical protein [Ktedonobacteraceae bacterium]